MNKEKLEELLNDLHDGAHGDRLEAFIPNDKSVIEEAYNLGLKRGIRTCTALVRSEPTTGAGLVKEVDDCIALATEGRESDKKGLWVCAGRQDIEHCNNCNESKLHRHDDFCGRGCSYPGYGSNSCLPYELTSHSKENACEECGQRIDEPWWRLCEKCRETMVAGIN